MVFQKEKKRISARILLPIIVSMILACVIVITTVAYTMLSLWKNETEYHMLQKQSTVNSFLSFIEEASMQFNAEEVKEKNVHLLDLVEQINGNILGAAYIDKNGEAVVSSQISGYPNVESIKSAEIINSFINSDNENVWFLRTENISDFYNNQRYDKSKGVLTFIRRESGGLLIIDVDPYALLNILDTDSDEKYSNATLIWKNEFMLQKNSDNIISEKEQARIIKCLGETHGNVWIPQNNTVMFSIPLKENIYSTVEVSYTNITSQLLHLVFMLLILAALFGLVAVLLSLILTKSITNPLERLYYKMQHEKLNTISKD